MRKFTAVLLGPGLYAGLFLMTSGSAQAAPIAPSNPLFWVNTSTQDDHGQIVNGPLANTSFTTQADSVTGANTETVQDAVNLSGAQLRVLASGSGTASPIALGNALFADTLTFNCLPGPCSNLVVPFSLTLNGSWTVNAASHFDFGSLFMLVAAPGSVDPNTLNTSSSLFSQTLNFGPGTTFPQTLSGSVTLSGVNAGFTFVDRLAVGAAVSGSGSFNADFSHTALLNFSVPAGVSVQSASGAFNGFSSVPEPGTWALLAAGLFAIGVFRLASRRTLCRP